MPRIKSIRLTIFLLYALILLVTFSLFSGIIYFYSHHQIYGKVDELLEMRARGIEESIRTYEKTRSTRTPKGWTWLFSRTEGKEEQQFSYIAGFLTENKLSFSEQQMNIYADIFDGEGNLIASSHTPPLIASLGPSILKNAREGQKQIYDYTSPIASTKRYPSARAMIQPFIENGEVMYLIQVRTSLSPIRRELASIRHLLILAVAITLIVASWAGIYLVKVTLRPVDQMVRKIRNIRSDNLSARLVLPDANDEIRELAHTFNEMLVRIEKSFEAQKQIVQDLSHELKTPLTIMRGQMEVTLKKTRTPEDYQALLVSNIEEVSKMRRIIDDLLMLARLDSRAAALEMKRVNLSELARSSLDDARVLAAEKGIDSSFEGPDDCLIEANGIHLCRLFSNLLDNAVKYTPKGGCIRVNLKEESSGVFVRVEDTGIGISAEHLPRIFERFYRANDSRPNDGYGLGLSIVHSIVTAHKGKIDIESTPGRGTTFHLYFHKVPPMPLF